MRLPYIFLLWFSRWTFMFLFRGRTFGREHLPRSGGALLVSNHQSYFDPIIIGMCLEREANHMARDSLFRNRWFSALIRYLNAFPVKRDTADLGAIKEAIRRLKSGAALIVYPEGTRSRDGDIGPMHGGVIVIARRSGVPIVPTLVLGPYECWPRDRALPSVRPIFVAFGEPVLPAQIAGMADEQAIALVRGRIIALRRRFERHVMMSHVTPTRADASEPELKIAHA